MTDTTPQQNAYGLLTCVVENSVARVTLSRPDVHNAFNTELIGEITRAFDEISRLAPEKVRVAVLAGAGRSFCAGADVNWMRESLQYTEEENIADALQWAMASQPPRQIRAQTEQDVLFAGSEQHAASGVCEVELVLDNSDGRVGVARSELSVMRRLDRAGDSDYLLNRQAVRRLDVRDLLAEAGLGRELHCIIAQGTVDQVLLSKPEERRGLVEEAAGLGKFKRRRQRATHQHLPGTKHHCG